MLYLQYHKMYLVFIYVYGTINYKRKLQTGDTDSPLKSPCS